MPFKTGNWAHASKKSSFLSVCFATSRRTHTQQDASDLQREEQRERDRRAPNMSEYQLRAECRGHDDDVRGASTSRARTSRRVMGKETDLGPKHKIWRKKKQKHEVDNVSSFLPLLPNAPPLLPPPRQTRGSVFLPNASTIDVSSTLALSPLAHNNRRRRVWRGRVRHVFPRQDGARVARSHRRVWFLPGKENQKNTTSIIVRFMSPPSTPRLVSAKTSLASISHHHHRLAAVTTTCERTSPDPQRYAALP